MHRPEEPQAQSSALFPFPSTRVQYGTVLHWLAETSQKKPVKFVHTVMAAPQKQGAGLAVAPSPWAQVGPVKAAHRQALEEKESQERVEAVFVLKYSPPPLVLLLVSKHPCGEPDHKSVSAVVSDQPTCPAAASHAALSSIHPYP